MTEDTFKVRFHEDGSSMAAILDHMNEKINYKNTLKNTDLRFVIRNISNRVVTVVSRQIRMRHSKFHGEIV